MPRINTQGEVCYLCGLRIKDDKNYDHIPPRQFFATEIRKSNNPNLTTLPTHRRCNSSFQPDEDYFVHTHLPFIKKSYSGSHIYEDAKKRFSKGRNVGLIHKILKEFDSNPSGLVLPSDKIIKRFEGRRIRRVVWKILRGLYYIENHLVLPEETDKRIFYTLPDDTPPDIFPLLSESPCKGKYPGVFDYRYVIHKAEEITFNIWGLLFWDRIITTIMFHDVECSCNKCISY